MPQLPIQEQIDILRHAMAQLYYDVQKLKFDVGMLETSLRKLKPKYKNEDD